MNFLSLHTIVNVAPIVVVIPSVVVIVQINELLINLTRLWRFCN